MELIAGSDFMRLFSAYDTEIKNSMNENGVIISLNKRILDDTLSVCRNALAYIISVLNDHYEEWVDLKGTDRNNYCEHLIHSTRNNIAICDFDRLFYKFPSGIRRSAVSEAMGIVSSYRSNHKNWEAEKKGNEPKLSFDHYWMPVIYRKNPSYAGGEIEKSSRLVYRLKVYKNHDWVWMSIVLGNNDVSYIERHCAGRKECSPALKKSHGRYYITWAFEEQAELSDKEVMDCRICAVDLGICSDAACTMMDSAGTVYARKVINIAYEKDQISHLCNRIRKNQKAGRSVRSLWSYAQNFNTMLSRKVANAIISFAVEHGADVIVFEHLDTSGKKKGSRKQKLHLWKHRDIQKLTEYKAHQLGMRISHVCAWGTSKLAFDGSGEVKRGKEVSKTTPYNVCCFKNEKQYNCDLSASYNIGARYYLREISIQYKDYVLPATPKRTLSDLWKANRELGLVS